MESKEFRETDLKIEALVTNSYYMLMEAADMMLRQMELQLARRGRGLKFKLKQRHNLMMDNVDALKNFQLDFWSDYRDAFKDNYSKSDALRQSAAYMARIMLLIADRCYTQEDNGTMEREQRIERYIYNMPDGGLLNDDLLKKFFVR
jgi:hypothetical protein